MLLSSRCLLSLTMPNFFPFKLLQEFLISGVSADEL